MDLSEKDAQRLHDHVLAVLEHVVPTSEQLAARDVLAGPRGDNPIPREIAKRIVMNARIVSRKDLKDQVLIVLADYRNHAWVGDKLAHEGKRLRLANAIMRWKKRKA
jgi:hypothetical protein